LEDVVVNRMFWKDKDVLITGHTGFKGTWLSLWLQNLGANVIGYSLPQPTETNLFDIAQVAGGMTSVEADIRDLKRLKSVIVTHQPQIIIHMAAQSLVRYSYDNPVETYTTNVIGTVNVLESVRQCKSVRVVVCITSDKCYDNKEWHWGYRENEAMGGRDPYSSSKGCAELVISAYRNSYFPTEEYHHHGVAIASTRAGNVIGGGDWAKDRLVPDTMNAFMEGRPVILRSPHAIRPWQHVLEPLHGYLCLAQRLWDQGSQFAQSWNFGPHDDAKSVLWIVKYLVGLWGDGAHWELDSTHQPHEDHSLKLDCSKAKSLLGWSPRLHLSGVLEWIVEWYRGYQQNANMRDLTEAQIARYENAKIP